MKAIRWMMPALVLGLAGCEATTFEKPPVAELACDAQLVGDWLSVADSGSNDTPGEVELQIDKTCHLSLIEHKKDGDVGGDATVLHVGRDGPQNYFWLDAAWAFKRAQSTEPAPAGDVYVLRYNISGKELQLRTANDRAIAHHILDDKLHGEVHKTESTLVNRLTGSVTPEQLRSMIAFDTKPARFTRRDTEPTK
ncbi:MAG TPA: hypothetical protein VGT79_08420 [Xanthomonadaceae bacterium]|nr:hypothetical protein [Xanthomonadaceae bacterium]